MPKAQPSYLRSENMSLEQPRLGSGKAVEVEYNGHTYTSYTTTPMRNVQGYSRRSCTQPDENPYKTASLNKSARDIKEALGAMKAYKEMSNSRQILIHYGEYHFFIMDDEYVKHFSAIWDFVSCVGPAPLNVVETLRNLLIKTGLCRHLEKPFPFVELEKTGGHCWKSWPQVYRKTTVWALSPVRIDVAIVACEGHPEVTDGEEQR